MNELTDTLNRARTNLGHGHANCSDCEHGVTALNRAIEQAAAQEAELAACREREAALREKVGWLPTAWRAQSLDFPEDGAPLYPSILLACADELERTLAILDAQPPQEPVCERCLGAGFVCTVPRLRR